jgi:hypothetical protein
MKRAEAGRARWPGMMGLLLVVAALSTAALLLRKPTPAGVSPVPVAASATPMPAPVVEPIASAPRPVASQASAVSTKRFYDLFSDFQLAQGSTQLGTIEKGIAAYEECFLYATPGGIEGYVSDAIPDGLDKAEWERRASHLRSRARRCAGFADQDVQARLRELQEVAIKAGSIAERARKVAEDPQSAGEQATVACAVVKGMPASKAAVRFIGPALNQAAASREGHVLRRLPPEASGVAVSLALCDLDPDACRRMLGLADSACAEEGLCNLSSDRDYLQKTTPPDLFAAADDAAREIEAMVARGDCAALFEP